MPITAVLPFEQHSNKAVAKVVATQQSLAPWLVLYGNLSGKAPQHCQVGIGVAVVPPLAVVWATGMAVVNGAAVDGMRLLATIPRQVKSLSKPKATERVWFKWLKAMWLKMARRK